MMEEDVGVSVKVTRLRRRLSVEQSDDVSSPSTPSKKRGGRLAAKPQLELIDENAQISSPRKTRRKSTAKDVAEAEEKPLTPSRRSTRVKSNTSIVSEILSAQITDSPRAKRALRRNSAAGSDNEGPVTPARQTRRTRKDSASSVENQEPAPVTRPLQVVEMVIDEEPENEEQKTARKSKSSPNKSIDKLSPDSARKSKRLLEKTNRRSGSLISDHDSSVSAVENKSLNASVKNEFSDTESKSRNKSRKSTESKESEKVSDTETKSHNKSRKSSESKDSEISVTETKSHDKSRKSFESKESEKVSDIETKSHNKSRKSSESKQSEKVSDTETKSHNKSRKSSESKQSEKVSDTETKSHNKSRKSSESKQSEKVSDTETKSHNKSRKSIESTDSEMISEAETKPHKKSKKSIESNVSGKLSDSNINLLKAIDSESNIKTSKHNKSTSTLHTEQNENKKRNRTESWPTLLAASPLRENIVFSDNEQSKKKKRQSVNKSFMNNSNINNTSTKEVSNDTAQNDKEHSVMLLDTSTKRKKRQSETSLADMPSEPVEATENPAPNPSNNEDASAVHQSSGNTEQPPANSGLSSEMAMLFQSPPGNIQAIVCFEDSDSNSVITETTKKIDELDNEDQCVPEVNHGLEFQEKMSPRPILISNCEENIFQPKPKNSNDEVDSCEPMDIDETIHEEILQKSHEMLQESATERKSLSVHQSGIMEERNKSKRKSSLNSRDTPDRSGIVVSGNENKSTLILSQIKDVSGTSENAQQSPKTATAELLSNSNNSDISTSNKLSKTNLSSNDLKETPLKQKSVLKLAMQTSTPINTPQAENKTKLEGKNTSMNKNDSNNSNSIDETVSDEDSDEESGEKSKLLDDEAEEASDDYESGDSRDEEEREYEEENEIVERGETLGSDDEASNDTEYEKDSFVVSSDAEVDELLSGSGDDLSMSDNELSMSKKSKKKYNERKLKEQKAASREMYESRHKLNTSDSKSPAPKAKNNRMRIDSSLIESDEEVVVTSKKKNRLRLDSTLDTSTKQEDTNESLNKSKKKSNKSLQDSNCNQSVINEKEITVCNEYISLTDPLQVQFKQEPKTPQKDLNMSVVQFTDRQEIENVEVAASHTILNQTETDPLQATMACEDYDSSESEEILQNYDSMLNELKANKIPKLNTNNASLNVGKKSKKDKNVTIIDQLNLTNTKKPNKKKVKSEDVVDSKKETPKVIQASEDEDSSNSIDLKLLFSEDNCGSGDENINNKDEPNNGEEEMFVPLRKSIGRTNINECLDVNTSQQNSSLNDSNKKKKRKSSLVSEDTAEPENTNKTTHDDNVNESIKKKNRKSSLVPTETEELQDANKSQDETTLNESKKKRNRKSSMAFTEAIEEPPAAAPIEDTSLLNKSNSKKKQRASVSISELVESSDIPNVEEPVLNESIKKKKKRKSSLVVDDAQPDGDLFFIDTAGAFASEPEEKSCFDKAPLEVLYVSEKKKNKKLDLSQNIEANDNAIEESSAKLPPKAQKKKKKNKHNLETSVVAEGDSDDAPEEVAYRSEKASNQETELTTETVAEPAETSGKKKKKKKKTSTVSEPSVETTNVSEELSSSKKRKRKPSDTGVQSSAQDVEEVVTGTLNESSAGNNKKKLKISHNSEANAQSNAGVDDSGDHEKKIKKKKHKKNPELNFENTVPEPEIAPTQIKKNKKRKDRDEDNDSKKTKVSKEDSFHEVHNIPPARTISRHEEKPKKPKVISTSNFIVENARQKRAKPSHYLEESIYLNDDSPIGKKEKPRMKKPKVLPFMPTASISESGYTTNFNINKLSQNVQFVAEPAGISFSKESYLQRKEIKRLGTYDRYKKQINKKLSKF